MNRYRPSYEEFARLLGSASCVPVYRQLTGDGLTPVSAFGRIERSAPSFLFESVIGGEKVGRFSFLGTEPFLNFEARGQEVTISRPGAKEPEAADLLRPIQSAISASLLRDIGQRNYAVMRFAGGAVAMPRTTRRLHRTAGRRGMTADCRIFRSRFMTGW